MGGLNVNQTINKNPIGIGIEDIKNEKKTNKEIKTPVPESVLNTMWKGSSVLKSFLFKDAIKREELGDKSIPDITVKINEDNNDNKEIKEAKIRYRNYSVYPPYPTRRIELTKGHHKLMCKYIKGHEKEVKELEESASKGSPIYKNLSPEARLFFNKINLDLIKEHLKDIQTLANQKENGNNLSSFGMDYFENEIYDTLSRGLAFVDKSLLKDIEVPVKQPDGTFELKKFDIERFNLSDGEKTKTDKSEKIDHNKGHPIFFLKPQQGEGVRPIVVARGTLLADDGNDGAKSSMQADGRKDLSLKWIMNNKELAAKMEEMYGTYGSCDVCGHSLGGHVAQILSIRFHHQIDQTVTISAPFLSNAVYEKWKEIPKEQRPQVINICVEGDLVPSGGKKIIGTAILAEQQDDQGKMIGCDNPIERHLKPFNNSQVRYGVIYKKKELGKIMRTMATAMVILTGRLMQQKKVTEHVIGTGERKEALNKLSEFISKSCKPETKCSHTDQDFEKKLKEDKSDIIRYLEKLSPAAIQVFCNNDQTRFENLLNIVGKDSISSRLALKIYIAAGDNDELKKSITERISDDAQKAVRIYEEQKDI